MDKFHLFSFIDSLIIGTQYLLLSASRHESHATAIKNGSSQVAVACGITDIISTTFSFLQFLGNDLTVGQRFIPSFIMENEQHNKTNLRGYGHNKQQLFGQFTLSIDGQTCKTNTKSSSKKYQRNCKNHVSGDVLLIRYIAKLQLGTLPLLKLMKWITV